MDPITTSRRGPSLLQLLNFSLEISEYIDTLWALRQSEWSKDLTRIHLQICSQMTIFRNEGRLILASLSSRDVAHEMIGSPRHPAWADPILNVNCSNQFENSGLNYTRVMSSVAEVFSGIIRNMAMLQRKQSATKPIPYTHLDSLAQNKRKAKVTFLTSMLSCHIEELQRLNAEFLALRTSTSSFEWRVCQTDPVRNLRLEQKLEEVRFLHKAAIQLYYALSYTCFAHQDHSSYFRLEHDNVSIQSSGPSSVNFLVAFSNCVTDGDPTGTDINLLQVNSVFYRNRGTAVQDTPSNPISAFASSCSNHLQPYIFVHNLKTTKGVLFHSSQASIIQPVTRLSIPNSTGKSSEDFSTEHNFCFYARSLILQSRGHDCIGYLEDADSTGVWRHLVYVLPRESGNSVSLAQLNYSVTTEHDLRRLSLSMKLRIAQKLANAVLCFHSTPWLQPSWESGDVYLYNIRYGYSSQDKTLTHLKVPLATTYVQNRESLTIHTKVPLAQNSQDERRVSKSFGATRTEYAGRNPYIIALGVALLELGHSKPLGSLRDDFDSENYIDSNLTDFLVVNRLSLTLGRKMGSAYAGVVQKCLRCDFGKGNELSDPDTQALFYQDVVCELERLEECGEELKLGN